MIVSAQRCPCLLSLAGCLRIPLLFQETMPRVAKPYPVQTVALKFEGDVTCKLTNLPMSELLEICLAKLSLGP